LRYVAEPDDYDDLVLFNVGPNKSNVIKVIRELTGRGLKEAKELVESVSEDSKPSINTEDLSPAVAADWARKLEAAGASIVVV
jgi:large subunit ribosomal protein L7/L12